MRPTWMMLLLAAFGTSLLPPPAHAWLFTLDGLASPALDQVTSVAVTPGGDLVAAGMTVNSGSDTDLTVVKLAGVGGGALWTTVVDGSAGSTDEPRQVLVDGVGDVFVGGTLQTTGDPRTLAVVKLSGADGHELWRHLISVPLNPYASIGAIALDQTGDVVVVGTAVAVANGSADFAVFKLSGADGGQLWRYTLDGSAGQGDYAVAVALDAAGDVLAGGTTNNLGTGDDFTVVKLSGATGTASWQRVLDGRAGDGDYLRALAVDAEQNVVVAGSMVRSNRQEDIAVMKLSGATGGELWRRFAGGSSRDFDTASAVAIDGSGDVVAAGMATDRRTGSDIAVLKLRGRTGRRLWLRRVDGGFGGRDDSAAAVAVDGGGNVVAGGLMRTSSNALLTVVSLSPRGQQRWRHDLAGSTVNGLAIASTLAVDGNGDVFAGGVTDNLGTGYDFTVLKLLGTTGADAP